MNAQLIVGIKDGQGNLIIDQPYKEYAKGNRNVAISIFAYGPKLFDILKDELGYIRIENNIFAFHYIFVHGIEETAMRLLGKIAEAIIVRRCNEDQNINRKWVKFARMGDKINKSADSYMAVGTGLLSTKKKYHTKYNPGDTQRDIKWVKRDNAASELMMVKSGGLDGNVAGLQSKVSTAGVQYIFQDLVSQRYEVPLVYFGVNNDYYEIAYKLFTQRKGDVSKYFLDAKAIDLDAYEELLSYIPLIKGLINKEIVPGSLLRSDYLKKDSTLQAAVINTVLEPFVLGSIVLP